MITTKTVTLNENIIQYVLDSVNPEHTVFVLPTFKNKSDAMLRFLDKWNFTNTVFYSFEEFKSLFFKSDFPVISSDKRKLLLYSVMDDQLKSELRITDYFSAISFMDNFFDFWEEIFDECVDPNTLLDTLQKESGALLLEEQKDFYKFVLELLNKYDKKLTANKLTDKIFLINKDRISIPAELDLIERFVFVNQYYFSNLEESLLKTLQEQNKSCLKFNQYTKRADHSDEEEITFEEQTDLRLKNIEIIEVPDNYSMYLEFLQHYELNTKTIVLNNSTAKDEIAVILADKYKMQGSENSLVNLFEFLTNLTALTENAKIESSGAIFFSLEDLRAFFSIDYNHKYSKHKASSYHYIISDKLTLLQIKKSYLSISFEKLSCVFKSNKEVTNILNIYKNLINMLLTENLSLIEFITYLFEHFDFCLDKNNCQSFWKSYYDLDSAYKHEFPVDINHVFTTNTCLNHLKLFMDIYKTASTINNAAESIEFTALNNTRNIFPETPVIVLHAEERILPSSPKKQFLFNDSQRKTLGLKTYEHIRSREKYYFFRLIANAESAVIISINNIEKDISVSSFVENLKCQLETNNNINYSFTKKDSFAQRFHEALEMVTGESSFNNEEATGLILPFEKDVFLKDRQIRISPSSYKILIDNPIDYYFRNILRLTPLEWKPENIITPLVFGIIFHEIMNCIFAEIRKNNRFRNNTLFNKNELSSLIDNAVDEIFSPGHNSELIYQIPGNMSLDFYKTHVIPFITDSVRVFINSLKELIKISPDNQPEIFIEGEFAPEIEKKGIELVNTPEYKVILRGRADLILYSKYYNSYYIIDFKSAEQKSIYNKDYIKQLEFYKFLYFFRDGRFRFSGKIYRMLMFLMDHSQIVNDGEETDIQEKVRDFFDDLFTKENLTPPESKSKIKDDFKELYRI